LSWSGTKIQKSTRSLDYLLLGTPPRSKESGDSSIFFKQLNTPKLVQLQFFILNHRDVASLSSLPSPSVPESLVIDRLSKSNVSYAKKLASPLINSIKHWKKLTGFQLRPNSMPLAFYKQVLYEVTPLSRENLKLNHKSMLLPNLQRLQLGLQTPEGSYITIDAVELAAFVASRKAASCGLSTGEVAFSAAGNLEASSGEASGKPEGSCCQITESVVKAAPVKSEEVVKSWIEENVPTLDVQWV